ncbi:MAG: TetR/AcrR family transcriptional regulator [Pseudomonadota bacterium]
MARPERGEERREQILNAFEVCVGQKGLEGTTLTDVAKEAGLPRPLLRHFMGNREQMVASLIDRIIARTQKQLADAVAQIHSQNTEMLLDFLFEGIFRVQRTNAVTRELWSLSRRDEGIKAHLGDIYQRICDVLIEQMRTDGLGADDAERAWTAYTLVALAFGDARMRGLGISPQSTGSARQMAQRLVASMGAPR